MKILVTTTTGLILFIITFFQSDFIKVQPNPIPEKNDAIILEGDISQSMLKTFNGCGVGNFLIPSIGDSTLGVSPRLGSLSDNWNIDYHVLDIIPGTEIKGVAFRREDWLDNTSIIAVGGPTSPYVVISDAGMFSYSVPGDFNPWSTNLNMLNTQLIPGIIKMAKQVTQNMSNPIVLYVKDSLDNYSLNYFSYPELEEEFKIPFHFEPEIFEVTEDGLFITGLDTTENIMLYHFSTDQDTLFGTYTLNDSLKNAQEILSFGDSLYILSSPGDSIIMLSKLNLMTSVLSQTVMYSKSGVRATYNEFKNDKFFTYQPKIDDQNAELNKQILILNPLNNQVDTLMVNLQLDYFKHPEEVSQSFGYFESQWFGAKWEENNLDTIYIYQYSDVLKVTTKAFPQFINITYGCWTSVNESELEKIKFEYFPNPASSKVTINLTGLKKGKKYKLDILDSSGKLQYTTSLLAYQKIELPLQKFAKGLYFLNLDTGKNVISKKLIIQ